MTETQIVGARMSPALQLGTSANTRITTDTATLTPADVGKVVDVQGTTQYTITIDDTNMVRGDRIRFLGSNSTRMVRVLSSNTHTIGYDLYLLIWFLRDVTIEFQGTRWEIVAGNKQFLGSSSQGIYFDSSMDRDEMQNWVNAAPHKTRSGHMDFYFAAGTYNLSSALNFIFFNAVRIYGDTSISSISTSQNVTIVGPTASSAFIIHNCNYALLNGFKIAINAPDSSTDSGAQIQAVTYADVRYNYIYRSGGILTGTGVYVLNSSMRFLYNYLSAMSYGIRVYCSQVYALDNDDTSTLPAYGMRAEAGSVVGYGGTFPAGSTSNTYTATGGRFYT